MKKIKYIIIILVLFSFSETFAQNTKFPQMIFVYGGTFKMGSNNGYPDEQPIHTVELDNYYISKYEITVSQYREYCRTTGVAFPDKPNKAWYVNHEKSQNWVWKDKHPIVNISWYDAMGYCSWLSEATGEEYTLPTEAQWEYAASGGSKSTKTTYAGSNNINEVAWFDETTDEISTKPVGKLKPNELGLYDMSGNAMEWCIDGYGDYQKKKQKNPSGNDASSYKTIRGGSWYYVSEFCKITQRDSPRPTTKKFDYGFRIVKNIK